VMAQRAAAAVDSAVVHYEDIAVEAIALRDEEAARDFVASELRGIDGSDTRSTRLRETLEAYFASGQNAAATAAALGVHEQTVGQRLRAVEERTGRPIIERRAELEVALRLLRQQRAESAELAGSGPP
jgi:DNA-binding PucR family transcriptional regulator